MSCRRSSWRRLETSISYLRSCYFGAPGAWPFWYIFFAPVLPEFCWKINKLSSCRETHQTPPNYLDQTYQVVSSRLEIGFGHSWTRSLFVWWTLFCLRSNLPIWHMVILFVDPSYFGCFVPVVFDYLVETIHLSILSYHNVPFLVKPCQNPFVDGKNLHVSCLETQVFLCRNLKTEHWMLQGQVFADKQW